MPIEYLAGIVDGEGHFVRVRSKGGSGYYSWQSRIIVVNTNKELMERLKESYGGSWRVRTPSRTNNLVCYTWTLTGKKAVELAERMRPFLIVRKEQVKRLFPPYPGYDANGHVLRPIYEANRLQANK